MSEQLQSTSLPATGYIRLPIFCGVTGFGKSKIYDLIKAGLAPKPHKVGRSSLWDVDEVRGFLEDIKAGKLA